MSDIKDQHYQALANMYLAAPINKIYQPNIEISKGEATITMAVKEDFFHAGGAVHGSVYFKMLDDAAYFAANSLEFDVFLLTTTFTTYLTRPISSGVIKAVGKVVNQNASQFIAESIAYNAKGKEIARGSGIFVRSKTALVGTMGYEQ